MKDKSHWPEHNAAEVYDGDVSTVEREGEDEHADDGGGVHGERGLLEAVRLVQDQAAHHGARHACHHDHQPYAACVYVSSLEQRHRYLFCENIYNRSQK